MAGQNERSYAGKDDASQDDDVVDEKSEEGVHVV
ncbi:unnamed protein product, partial [marine sediment metagenome]